MKEIGLYHRIELALLIIVAGLSVIIAILDTAGLLDGVQWIAQRIPALILLCVGFIASYLILERRGKLNEIALLINERSDAILNTVGVEVQEYHTSGDWSEAMALRISRAKRVDDVSWAELGKIQFRWSQADRAAHARCDELVAKVIRDPKITWREIYIFFPGDPPDRFQSEKKNLLDKKAVGYSVGYFDAPPPEIAPRIGGFMVVDSGEKDAEIFVASSDSTIWLKIKHPALVRYYSNYFESLWINAKKLKVGPSLNNQLLQQLEKDLAQSN
jgi:hypothetical protein